MIGLLEPKPVSRVLLILCKYAIDKNRRYVLFCQCCHRKSSRPLSASNIEQYSDLSHKTPDEAIVQASFSDLKVTIYARLDVICALPYSMSKKIAEWFISYCGTGRLQFELCCKQKWRPSSHIQLRWPPDSVRLLSATVHCYALIMCSRTPGTSNETNPSNPTASLRVIVRTMLKHNLPRDASKKFTHSAKINLSSSTPSLFRRQRCQWLWPASLPLWS